MKAIVEDARGSADVVKLADIDTSNPLNDAPRAIQNLEDGRARGNVVISLAQSS